MQLFWNYGFNGIPLLQLLRWMPGHLQQVVRRSHFLKKWWIMLQLLHRTALLVVLTDSILTTRWQSILSLKISFTVAEVPFCRMAFYVRNKLGWAFVWYSEWGNRGLFVVSKLLVLEKFWYGSYVYVRFRKHFVEISTCFHSKMACLASSLINELAKQAKYILHPVNHERI